MANGKVKKPSIFLGTAVSVTLNGEPEGTHGHKILEVPFPTDAQVISAEVFVTNDNISCNIQSYNINYSTHICTVDVIYYVYAMGISVINVRLLLSTL